MFSPLNIAKNKPAGIRDDRNFLGDPEMSELFKGNAAVDNVASLREHFVKTSHSDSKDK